MDAWRVSYMVPCCSTADEFSILTEGDYLQFRIVEDGRTLDAAVHARTARALASKILELFPESKD